MPRLRTLGGKEVVKILFKNRPSQILKQTFQFVLAYAGLF